MLYWQILALLNGRGIMPIEGDFALQDDSDGSGPFIKKWNGTKLGAAPTNAELDAALPNAMILKAEALKNPNDELDAALTALKGTGATVDQLIKALRGEGDKRGRVAARSV